ncbi:MAG: thioesterase family protein [Clostridia bacterium]|nr:thioesterase family protein [Clostridia bacterium]
MELKIGIKGKKTLVVLEKMLANSVGSGAIPVFSTPWMVALMEGAAQESVADAIGEGNVTVGTSLEISHLAATPLGMEVYAESELVEIDGRRLVFNVVAYDGVEKIGEGKHQRFIVGAERFVDKCKSKMEKI